MLSYILSASNSKFLWWCRNMKIQILKQIFCRNPTFKTSESKRKKGKCTLLAALKMCVLFMHDICPLYRYMQCIAICVNNKHYMTGQQVEWFQWCTLIGYVIILVIFLNWVLCKHYTRQNIYTYILQTPITFIQICFSKFIFSKIHPKLYLRV